MNSLLNAFVCTGVLFLLSANSPTFAQSRLPPPPGFPGLNEVPKPENRKAPAPARLTSSNALRSTATVGEVTPPILTPSPDPAVLLVEAAELKRSGSALKACEKVKVASRVASERGNSALPKSHIFAEAEKAFCQ